jgi:autotransporter passenger strand-loop-strand repeat protein
VTVDHGGVINGPGEIYGYGVVAGSASGVVFGGSSAYGYSPTLEIVGAATSVTVSSGTLQIDAGATASGDRILNGGEEKVRPGAVDVGTVVLSGGYEIVSGLGGASSPDVSSMTVQRGAYLELVGAVLSSGSALPPGGAATATTVFGGITVASGGAVQYVGATVSSGAVLSATSGLYIDVVTLSSGGSLIASSGAEVEQVTVQSGAVLTLSSGAFVAFGLQVSAGGLVSGAGAILNFPGGTVAAGTVSGVSIGADSGPSHVPQAGSLELLAGGVGEALVIEQGGLQVDSGASASGDQVYIFGSQTVLSGGSANLTVLYSGGFETLSSGAVETGATVSSGGLITGAGTLSGATVDLGEIDSATVAGSVTLSAGGRLSAVTVGSGGALIVEAGTEAGITALNLLVGAAIDLAGVSATSAFVNGSNQLVATSGGVTVATIGLGSTPVGAEYVTSGDGAGGTDITVINPPTQVSAPASAITLINKATPIAGVSIVDARTVAGETYTVRLAESHGKLGLTGAGVKYTAGNLTATVTGTLAQVNAILATLTDKEPATPGADTVTISVTDSKGVAVTPAAIALIVNGRPVTTAPKKATLVKAVASAITGISVAETGKTTGEIFTVTLTDAKGLIGAAGTGITGAGTKAVTLTGSLAAVNADLATLTVTEAATGADTLKIGVTDSLGQSAAAVSVGLTTIKPAVTSLAQSIAAFAPSGLAALADGGPASHIQPAATLLVTRER